MHAVHRKNLDNDQLHYASVLRSMQRIVVTHVSHINCHLSFNH